MIPKPEKDSNQKKRKEKKRKLQGNIFEVT